MSTNLNFNADLESNLISYSIAGQVIFTESSINLVKTDGTQIKYKSTSEQVEKVDTLPTLNIDINKLYLLSTDKSINVYNGTSWDKYGGTGTSSVSIDDSNVSPTTAYSSNKTELTYVKQVAGKSLVDDTKVTNYDNHISNTTIHITQSDKDLYADKYTKSETDNKISAVVTSLDYKEHVPTFNAISTTYPTPEKGWTVSVDDDNITYKYDGTNWAPIFANAIPMATSTVDGKMSSSDFTKLQGISTGATKVESSTTNGNVKINSVETQVYQHPSTHSPSIISQDANNRFATDTEKTTWNNKLDKTNIKAGTNINISTSGNDVTINASFSGSGTGDMSKSIYDTNNDGIVNMSDKLSSELSASNGTVYYKNNSGIVGWYQLPITVPTTSSVKQLEFSNLTTNVPVSQDFYPVLSNCEGLVQCYEFVAGSNTTEIINDYTNNLITNKTDNTLVDGISGIKIKDSYDYNLTVVQNTTYIIKESQLIDMNEFISISSIQNN